ncbi:MAG TPA: hypothetical protein VLK65_07880 [Vicinamibacteria bacterium]|nr:hypothetical protein [Vicinamibacteria bacterium]
MRRSNEARTSCNCARAHSISTWSSLPDGIKTFEEADRRGLTIEGMRVCHIDDIIRSKEAAGRVKDRESLPRLKAFRDWWMERGSG